MTLLRASVILQQPLDVIEFDLRAQWVAEAAAQFLENPAYPLHVDLAGNLHRQIVAEFAAAQWPAQRIAVAAAALLPAGAIAGAIVLPVAVARLHLLREVLGALAQRVQRLALRIHCAIGIAFAEPAVGIAHRGVGIAKTVVTVAVVALLTLVALLSVLPLLALLALLALLPLLPHAALGQFLLQFLQPVAQALLVLLQVAQRLVALL